MALCVESQDRGSPLRLPAHSQPSYARVLQASSSNGAASTVAAQPGLLLPCGEGGAWDEAGVGHPVVRYYLGDDEQRWFMWYTGRSQACQDMDGIFPSSGSIGAPGRGTEGGACRQQQPLPALAAGSSPVFHM